MVPSGARTYVQGPLGADAWIDGREGIKGGLQCWEGQLVLVVRLNTMYSVLPIVLQGVAPHPKPMLKMMEQAQAIALCIP